VPFDLDPPWEPPAVSSGQIVVAVHTAEAAVAALVVASIFERVENFALESAQTFAQRRISRGRYDYNLNAYRWVF
jgi:hypothetical protein